MTNPCGCGCAAALEMLVLHRITGLPVVDATSKVVSPCQLWQVQSQQPALLCPASIRVLVKCKHWRMHWHKQLHSLSAMHWLHLGCGWSDHSQCHRPCSKCWRPWLNCPSGMADSRPLLQRSICCRTSVRGCHTALAHSSQTAGTQHTGAVSQLCCHGVLWCRSVLCRIMTCLPWTNWDKPRMTSSCSHRQMRRGRCRKGSVWSQKPHSRFLACMQRSCVFAGALACTALAGCREGALQAVAVSLDRLERAAVL